MNANDFGDFFFGLPVDCAAPDDLSVAVGADNDPNVEAALSYLETGACPAASIPGAQFKLEAAQQTPQPIPGRTPARAYANAF